MQARIEADTPPPTFGFGDEDSEDQTHLQGPHTQPLNTGDEIANGSKAVVLQDAKVSRMESISLGGSGSFEGPAGCPEQLPWQRL